MTRCIHRQLKFERREEDDFDFHSFTNRVTSHCWQPSFADPIFSLSSNGQNQSSLVVLLGLDLKRAVLPRVFPHNQVNKPFSPINATSIFLAVFGVFSSSLRGRLQPSSSRFLLSFALLVICHSRTRCHRYRFHFHYGRRRELRRRRHRRESATTTLRNKSQVGSITFCFCDSATRRATKVSCSPPPRTARNVSYWTEQ